MRDPRDPRDGGSVVNKTIQDTMFRACGVGLVALSAARVCQDTQEWGWFFLGLAGWVCVQFSHREKEEPTSTTEIPTKDPCVDWFEAKRLIRKHKPKKKVKVTPPESEMGGTEDLRAVDDEEMCGDDQVPSNTLAVDLTSALVNLGLSKTQAAMAVHKAVKEMPVSNFDSLFKLALTYR